MLRIVTAAVIAAHGLIHLIGFVVPFQVATLEGFSYHTTALNGAIDLGATGARLVGVAWLIIAAGFVVAALGLWRRAAWAPVAIVVLAAASIVVCTLGLPEAVAGIVVDAVLIGAFGYVGVAHRPGRSG